MFNVGEDVTRDMLPVNMLVPVTARVLLRVVAPFTAKVLLAVRGCKNVAAPLLDAKLRAVLSALPLLGVSCSASELLPAPESVNSHRQHGRPEGTYVLQSIAIVVPPLPGPYTLRPLCPLAVVVTWRLLLVIAPVLVTPVVVDAPDTERVLATIGPDMLPVLLRVPVLTMPVRAEDPLTDNVVFSEAAPLAESVPLTVKVLAATGPEMLPVLDNVPVFVIPVRTEDPLARKVPFTSNV